MSRTKNGGVGKLISVSPPTLKKSSGDSKKAEKPKSVPLPCEFCSIPMEFECARCFKVKVCHSCNLRFCEPCYEDLADILETCPGCDDEFMNDSLTAFWCCDSCGINICNDCEECPECGEKKPGIRDAEEEEGKE
jgi:hypothetical protein